MDDLDQLACWNLLDLHADKPVVGRADFKPIHFTQLSLSLHPDWDPERHVNVVNWPLTEIDQIEIAQKLYEAQSFQSRQNP